jgi:hypothetical protein
VHRHGVYILPFPTRGCSLWWIFVLRSPSSKFDSSKEESRSDTGRISMLARNSTAANSIQSHPEPNALNIALSARFPSHLDMRYVSFLSSLFYRLAWVPNLKISFIRLQLTNHVHYRLDGGGSAPTSAGECQKTYTDRRGRAINLLLFL